MEQYKIITSNSASILTKKVSEAIADGWKTSGSHMVVESHRQNRYRGSQHIDCVIDSEYSQTVVKI